MAQKLDKDTQLIVVIGVLVIQAILFGASILYFRKKENDSLYTLFRLEDRINQLELQMREKRSGKPPSQVEPAK